MHSEGSKQTSLDSNRGWLRDHLLPLKFQSRPQDVNTNFQNEPYLKAQVKSFDEPYRLGDTFPSIDVEPFQTPSEYQSSISNFKNIQKSFQTKSLVWYILIALIATLIIAIGASLRLNLSFYSSREMRLLDIKSETNTFFEFEKDDQIEEFDPNDFEEYNTKEVEDNNGHEGKNTENNTTIIEQEEFYENSTSNSTQQQVLDNKDLENKDQDIKDQDNKGVVDEVRDLDDLSEFVGLNESQVLNDESNFTYPQGAQLLNDPTIQWPLQNQPYHIYTPMHPHLVLGIDNYRDAILYDWVNQLHEMYYFQRVFLNYYYIINVETKEYMAQPQRFIWYTNIPKVRFSKIQRKIWKLIPAYENVNVKNSFYIVSKEDQAVDIHFKFWSIQKLAEIVQQKFEKRTSQAWVLRKNPIPMNFQNNKSEEIEKKPQRQTIQQRLERVSEQDAKKIQEREKRQKLQQIEQRYSQRLCEIFQRVNSKFYNINDAITFYEMRTQMNLRNISYPQWMTKPVQPHVAEYNLPYEISDRTFDAFFKKAHIQREIKEYEQSQVSDNTTEEVDDDEDEQEQAEQEDKDQVPKQSKNPSFMPLYVTTECAKNHKIAYIWYGKREMPKQYRYLLYKCRDNVVLLRQQEFQDYVAEWNKLAELKYQIKPEELSIRQRVNMLKLLYLYFESGAYADFDTQINERCFDKVFTNEIIFTNRMEDRNPLPYYFSPIDRIIPPEESFMMVRQKFNPQVKRMIEQKVLEPRGQGDRWRECKYRQCLIVECQRHYRDNTYKKGYD